MTTSGTDLLCNEDSLSTYNMLGPKLLCVPVVAQPPSDRFSLALVSSPHLFVPGIFHKTIDL